VKGRVARVLNRAAGGNLSTPLFVCEASWSRPERCARGGAVGPQSFEPAHVDRFERQDRLEARLGCGIELACRL
jgi:hypothetical protein